MAIREKRFPLDIGQLTVISSFGRAQALSRVIQRLKPLSSKKQTFAFFLTIQLYLVQQSCLFYSDLVVLRSLGTHFTRFFLNLPTFSSLATVVRVISTLWPSFMNFKSQILLSSTVSSFCVMNGFSFINLATCYNRSRVTFLYEVLFPRFQRLILQQKPGSSIHYVQSLWMVLLPILKSWPIYLTVILGPLQSWLFSHAQHQSNFLASKSNVFLVRRFLPFLPKPFSLRLPSGSISRSLNYFFSFFICVSSLFSYCLILLASCFMYFRFYLLYSFIQLLTTPVPLCQSVRRVAADLTLPSWEDFMEAVEKWDLAEMTDCLSLSVPSGLRVISLYYFSSGASLISLSME